MAVMTSRPRPRQSSAPKRISARAIALIGFMSSGKTSVGTALSRRLGWTFHDLDALIENQQGRRIPEIFRASGEEAFRRAEREVLSTLLKELSLPSPGVIALGGGAFIQPEIRQALSDAEVAVVWLDAPLEELWQRCSRDGTERPLASDLNQFRQLYEARRKHYTEAALHIDTGGKEVEQIAEELIERLVRNGYLKET
jgi:shikimate kinase